MKRQERDAKNGDGRADKETLSYLLIDRSNQTSELAGTFHPKHPKGMGGWVNTHSDRLIVLGFGGETDGICFLFFFGGTGGFRVLYS